VQVGQVPPGQVPAPNNVPPGHPLDKRPCPTDWNNFTLRSFSDVLRAFKRYYKHRLHLHNTTVKIVPDMTYNVFGGTLNLAQSITRVKQSDILYSWFVTAVYDWEEMSLRKCGAFVRGNVCPRGMWSAKHLSGGVCPSGSLVWEHPGQVLPGSHPPWTYVPQDKRHLFDYSSFILRFEIFIYFGM